MKPALFSVNGILQIALQLQDVTNRALTLLRNAGVELVPFDSSPLDVAANAYPIGRSLTFEEPEVFAR